MSSPPPSPNDLTRQQLDELDTLLQRMLSLPLTGPAEATPPTAAPPPPLPDLPPVPPSFGGWRSDPPTPAPSPHLSEARVAAPPAVQLAPVLPPGVSRPAVADAHPLAAPVPTWDPDPLARHRAAPPRPAPVEPFTPPTPETGIPPSTAVGPAVDAPATTGTLRGVDAPAVPLGFRSPFDDSPAVDVPEPATVALTTAAKLSPPAAPADRVPLLLWPVFALNWVLELVFGLFGPVGAAMTQPPLKHLLGVVGVLLLAAAGVWAARGMGWVTLPWPR